MITEAKKSPFKLKFDANHQKVKIKNPLKNIISSVRKSFFFQENLSEFSGSEGVCLSHLRRSATLRIINKIVEIKKVKEMISNT